MLCSITRIYRIILLMVIVMGHGTFPVRAQWTAVCYKTVLTDTSYDIRRDEEVRMAYAWYFPEYSYYDNINALHGGVECSYTAADPVRSKTFKSSSSFDDSVALFMRVYTENVGKYVCRWFDAHDNKWRTKEVPLPFDGYQIPTTELLRDWNVELSTGDEAPGNATVPGYTLSVSVIPSDTGKPCKLVIGDLAIGTLRRQPFTVRHSFFSVLRPASQAGTAGALQGHYPMLHSDYFNRLPEGMDDYSLSSRIEILAERNGQDGEDPGALLTRIIMSSLDQYPFYTERRLDRADIHARVRTIFRELKDSAYCQLVDSLSRYIRHTFNDLHFYIDDPGHVCKMKVEEKQKPAVRVIQLGRRCYIAARFDTAYKNIKINDELLAIDGRPVQKVIDSLAGAIYGQSIVSAYERYAIVSSLLDLAKGDSCIIQTRKEPSGSVSRSVIKCDRKYSIPANFRPIHAEYRRYGDVAYFRINYWEEAVYLRFINHWDDIRTAGKIIIDLRGNGGGELMSAMQLFALFITKPQPYFWNIGDNDRASPVMILPDRHYSFPPSKKVIILADQSTACASETFIKAMQYRGNAWYAGAGNTAGSLAAKFDIRLPAGTVVHVNSLQKKVYYEPRGAVIETRGIKPDLLIRIDKVEDLRPYNDKLLKEAIKILSADNRGLAENRTKE